MMDDIIHIGISFTTMRNKLEHETGFIVVRCR